MQLTKFLGALCLGTVLAFAAAPASAAYPLKVAGGPATGAYLPFANAICGTALGGLFNCIPLETKGAQANVNMLNTGAADLAIMKGNLAQAMAQDPSFQEKYTLVRSLPGEAVMMIMTEGTAKAVINASGALDNAFLLSFGLPGEQSGDASVFNDLRAVKNSPLKDAARIDILDTRPALIAAVKSGKTQIGFVVQYPNPDNDFFKQVNDAGLVIMGFVSPDLPAIADVTTSEVTVSNASWGKGAAKTITTALIQPAIIARNPSTYTDPTERKTVERAIQKIKAVAVADLLPKVGWVTDMLNSASKMVASIPVTDMYRDLRTQAAGAGQSIKALASKL